MQKIESFKIDHTRPLPGLYTSRADGDITTYDIRFKKPNSGDIPGVSAVECGNYLEHDLDGAKKECAEMKKVMENYTAERLKY